MTVESKFESVRALIEEHNQAVGEGNPGFVKIDDFLSCLKAIGGTTDERLKRLKYEDIEQCLPDVRPGVKPSILAKEIAGIFREKGDEESSTYVSGKKANRMSPAELVDAFDPEEATSRVAKRLKEISKGEAFIVYESGRVVDKATTKTLLGEIKQGFPARQHVTVAGKPKPVYKIGDLPDNYVDENPLYPKRPLRPDGTCDQTGRSWEGIELTTRQFLRVAIDAGEIKMSIDKAHEVLDMVLSDDKPLEKLRVRFPNSSIKFDELEKRGKLPDLQVAVGDPGKGRGNPRPFDQGAKVVWMHPTPEANYYVNQRPPFGTWNR